MLRSVYPYFLILLSTIAFAQETPDFYAIARKGTIAEASAYLTQFPDAVNALNPEHFSPLILACYNGNNAVANFLIDKNADVNFMSPMGTALMAAVVKKNDAMAQQLLQHNANPNLADSNGNTALIYAVKFQNPELVALLLQYKADKSMLDKMQKSAFEYAAFSGNQPIIELLK